jgi:hypothetical protein
MKLPPVGWAFFGLAVVVLAGYVLNRGIFIGSDVRPRALTLTGGQMVTVYSKHCRYLHFTGFSDDRSLGENDTAKADAYLCPMFGR